MGFGHRQLFKHKTQPGGASGGYVSPYLLEILSTRSGAPSWLCAAGTLTANTGQTVSCTRASSGYCLGRDGLLHLLGSNTVRVEPAGLLVEGAATNSLAPSNDPTGWNVENLACTQNVTGPDGVSNSAWTLDNGSSAGNHRFYLGTNNATTTAYAFYAKAGTASFIGLSGIAGSVVVVWDVSSGTVASSSGTGVTSSIQALANGWYRCVVVCTSTGAGNFIVTTGDTLAHATGPNNSYTGNNTTVLFWQVDQVALPFATSPIITTSAAATRDADVVTVANPLAALSQPVPTWHCQMTATPLSTWLNTFNATPGPDLRFMVAGTDGGVANSFQLHCGNAVGLTANVWDAAVGVKVVDINSGVFSGSAKTTFGFKDTSGGALDTIPNGGTLSGAGTGIVSTAPTPVSIGSSPTFGWASSAHYTDIIVDNT